MLEIDIEPHQRGKKIGHRSSGRRRGPRKVGPRVFAKITVKDKKYVGSLSHEGPMHVVCMMHEGLTHMDNPRRR